MSKGCLAVLGCGACVLLGGVPVGAGAFFYLFKARQVSRPTFAVSTADPRAYATPRYSSLREMPTVAPVETPEEKPTRPAEAWVTATQVAVATPQATIAPRPTPLMRSYSTPRPVVVATPRPTAPPVTRAAVVAATAKPVIAAVKTPAATPLPWEEHASTAANTVAALAATPAPKLPAVSVATAAPVPTPKPVPVDPNARVIHAMKGDRSVSVNKNIAITGSDGKTVVGVLVNVSNGFIDVRVAGQLLRIGEHDVQDAATY